MWPNPSKKELSSYGLMVIQTKPDGNCFFQAIAINIARNKNFNIFFLNITFKILIV